MKSVYLISIDYTDPQTGEMQYNEIRCAFTSFAAAQRFLDEIAKDWSIDNPDQYLTSKTRMTAQIKSSNPQRFDDIFISIVEVPLYDF